MSLTALARALLLASGLPLCFAACGQADFGGGQGRAQGGADLRREDDELVEEASDPVETPEFAGPSVVWNWPCDTQPSSGTMPLAPAIEGGGTYTAEPGVAAYQIQVTGELCDGALPPRDVLFVFDASNSMKRNDPMVNGTCGRLEALKAVAATYVGKSKSRFGLVTFSRDNSRLTLSSNGFFATSEELAQAVSAAEGKDFAEVLCDSNHLGTNYDVAFGEAAEQIRLYGDPTVETALFFVSDGKPTFGHDGESQVATLKQAKVLINTLAVKGKESLMRDQIASRDARGLPMHVDVSDSSKLADAMVLLNNQMTAPGRFSYRAAGATAWTDVDVLANAGGLKFTLPPFLFDQASHPAGLEVQYEYTASGPAGKVQIPAKLEWPADAPAEEAPAEEAP